MMSSKRRGGSRCAFEQYAQRTDKGRPPLTSVRPVDLVVSEMAVIGFPDGQATLLEIGPGVSVEQVVAATEVKLAIPDNVVEMRL